MLTRKTAGTFFIILEICASFDKNYCKFDSFFFLGKLPYVQ